MAKVTVEFTRAEVTASGGYLFQTASGQQLIFSNIQDVADFVAQVETEDNAIRLGVGRLLYQEPNLTPNAQGKLPYLLAKAVDVDAVSADQVVIR